MKFTKSQLQKIINEEIKLALAKRKSASFIFEDAAEDIENAYSKGPAAVRSLANNAEDKEELKVALQGDYDKKTSDDVVSNNAGTKSVGELLPTQKEIDLVKSIGWPLGDLKTLEAMIKTGTSTAPGAITVSDNLVIDGHHRWSGIWSISGPKGKVAVDDLKLPGKSTDEKLAAAQLAIAAYKEPGTEQPAAAEPIELNILGKAPEAIEKDILAAEGQKDPKAPGAVLNPEFLDACSKSKVVADWAGFKVGDDIDAVKSAVVKKTAENLASLPKNPEAPARADMPQFDAETIGGKKAKAAIVGGLQKGDYNVSPPFKPSAGGEKGKTQAESSEKQGEVILERWHKLAGLIK